MMVKMDLEVNVMYTLLLVNHILHFSPNLFTRFLSGRA
jgi:hypothetical protein